MLLIRHLQTKVYHPQTDGMVEQFNKTLKKIMRVAIQ